jgi:hypothetical protein
LGHLATAEADEEAKEGQRPFEEYPALSAARRLPSPRFVHCSAARGKSCGFVSANSNSE